MIIPNTDSIDLIIKRYYYYGDQYRDSWWRWRWLLWLLILIPIFFLLLLMLWRRKKRSRQVNYTNTTQQPLPNGVYYQQTYIPPSAPQTSQPQPQGNYGGYGYQTEQTGTYDYVKPEGPPPAHTKF